VHGFRQSAVIRVDEVERPAAPTGQDLLIAVSASSVNGTDLMLRRGDVALARLQRAPVSLGFDVVGTVIDCGRSVTAFERGDRVMALLGHAGGGQSEFAVVPQRSAALVPESMTDAEAAALPLAGLTALQALRGVAALGATAGQRVCVTGAAGGIGSFAVQLAALSGATVTAVAGAGREDYLRGLGADAVLDRRTTDPFDGSERWDIVLDAPGRLAFDTVRPALSPRGVLVSTRPVSVDSLRMLVPRLPGSRNPRYAIVTTRRDGRDLDYLARLVREKRLVVPIDRAFAMDDVAAAHRHAESGGVRGKVVVTVDAST
jgi:NADPH:quinone reductase-like Zn-dependent oxidoreductase